MRQPHPDASIWVRTYPVRLGQDFTIARHAHEWDQFTFAVAGAMRVETMDGSWTVPPHGAVWIPCGVEHTERMYAGVSIRTLYFKRRLTRALPRCCRTLNVSPFLRELVLQVSRVGVLDCSVARHARLAGVLLDELDNLPETPLQLPAPRDPRAIRFARLVEQEPGGNSRVEDLARHAGASRRTLERLFAAETGMALGEWRRRFRLLHAFSHLASGKAVTNVAIDSGYSSPSAFIAAFKRTFGATPRHYRRA